MTSEEMVLNGIKKFFKNESFITLESNLDVFQSKLDFMEFLCYLEELANLKFDPQEVKNFKTFNDVNLYILQRLI